MPIWNSVTVAVAYIRLENEAVIAGSVESSVIS